MKLKTLDWKEAPGHPSLRYVETHTQNKKCGVSLFIRLVVDGDIQRATGEC